MASGISLLDLTEGERLTEWWVVYHPRDPYFFWASWLKQGFRHAELWRPYQFGKAVTDVVWLRLTPTFELIELTLELDPTPPWILHPGCTAQKVQVLHRDYTVRQWFAFGPPSCVEVVKHALGINKFWLRTPFQLYRYIKKLNGVIRT